MLRGFRHTLFLLLQLGVLASGLVALAVRPDSWQPIAICVAGSFAASLVCERIASHYLRKTLGTLRRTADELGRGRSASAVIDVQPGDDFYKLVSAINAVATRLDEASHEELRLQEELRRRERLAFLGQLAATVAHEVNNPLDGVQNCARILRRNLDDQPRARQMLDLIDSGLKRIELIVRRLLTLARENVIRPEVASIRDVIDAAVETVQDKLTARNVLVEVLHQSSNDHARVDAALLTQVFVNLLINAVDSMPAGGTITITIRDEPGGEGTAALEPRTLVVEVADTGSGIPADVLPHIFEPFYTTKPGGKGTGLGLAIAARIVDAHQGTISVCASDEGGTVFAVRLPTTRAEPPERRSPADAASAAARAPAPAGPLTPDATHER